MRYLALSCLLLTGCWPSSAPAPVPQLTPAEVCQRFAFLQGQVIEVGGEARGGGAVAYLFCPRPPPPAHETAAQYSDRIQQSLAMDNKGVMARISVTGPVVLRGRVGNKENGWIVLEDVTVVRPPAGSH